MYNVYYSLYNNIINISDWITVERNVTIPWDLEATPLQIKTNTALDTREEIVFGMYGKEISNRLTRVYVLLTATAKGKFKIGGCTGNNFIDLPVQPPKEVDKIWTFTKTETSLSITCNDVEVVDYVFADSPKSNCVPHLGGDVEQIIFESFNADNYDTASDFYRAGKCLNLICTTSNYNS